MTDGIHVEIGKTGIVCQLTGTPQSHNLDNEKNFGCGNILVRSETIQNLLFDNYGKIFVSCSISTICVECKQMINEQMQEVTPLHQNISS